MFSLPPAFPRLADFEKKDGDGAADATADGDAAKEGAEGEAADDTAAAAEKTEGGEGDAAPAAEADSAENGDK